MLDKPIMPDRAFAVDSVWLARRRQQLDRRRRLEDVVVSYLGPCSMAHLTNTQLRQLAQLVRASKPVMRPRAGSRARRHARARRARRATRAAPSSSDGPPSAAPPLATAETSSRWKANDVGNNDRLIDLHSRRVELEHRRALEDVVIAHLGRVPLADVATEELQRAVDLLLSPPVELCPRCGAVVVVVQRRVRRVAYDVLPSRYMFQSRVHRRAKCARHLEHLQGLAVGYDVAFDLFTVEPERQRVAAALLRQLEPAPMPADLVTAARGRMRIVDGGRAA